MSKLEEEFNKIEGRLDGLGIIDEFQRWYVQVVTSIVSHGAKGENLNFFYSVYPISRFGILDIK